MSELKSQIALVEPLEQADGASAWKDIQELTKWRLNILVLITALIGYVLAAGDLTDIARLLSLMFALALAAAGASILNQYIERDADRLMKRTRNRPLPAGRFAPTNALLAGIICIVVGISGLALFVNLTSSLLCALTCAVYLCLYTPLKRRTPLCTIVGAFPGALPPVIGWVAATGEVTLGAWVLFSILFMWQLPHFFAIAWIYRDDYAAAGQPMISLLDDNGSTTAQHMVMCLFNLVFVSLIPVATHMAGLCYLVVAVLLGFSFIALGIRFWHQRSVERARWVLFGSLLYLPGLLTMWLVDAI